MSDGTETTTGRKADPQYTDGAAHVTQAGVIAGERNVDSADNSYLVTKNECNATVLQGTGAVAVSAGAPAHLLQVLILTTGTTATITGFKDNLGAAHTVVLTAVADCQIFDMKGARCEAALIVTPSVDEDVVVFWRAI